MKEEREKGGEAVERRKERTEREEGRAEVKLRKDRKERG